MLEKKDLDKIKKTTEDFFDKMTTEISNIEVSLSSVEDSRDIVDVSIKLSEPQILIGQQGQTLFEIQRLLRTVLNKKLSILQNDLESSAEPGQKVFYLNLDINDYKKKKIEYLKDLAKELADQVSLTKEEKVLSPMSAYERRVIHAELSQRTDVVTESKGDGFDRHIVIVPH